MNFKKVTSLLLALAMLLSITACGGKTEAPAEQPAEAGIYTPGTYTASANGMNGAVEVSVTVDADKITAIEVGEHSETPGISDPAIEQIPAAIVEAGSTEVDGIAGATITSDAIKAAVEDALAMARGEEVATEVAATELPFEKADVVVVGAGMSGITAAIKAADLGANVILFEKNAQIGGSALVAGGTLSGAGTQMQKDAGIEDSPEKFIEDIQKLGGGTNNPELTKYHAEHSAAAVDEMDALGVDFGDRIPTQPSTYMAMDTPRESRMKGGAKAVVEAYRPQLEKHIENGKIALLLNTPVTDIVIEDNAVVGVVTDTDTYNAGAVILATGGYGHNEEWINEYNFANVLTTAPASSTGDGYNFARKAGAGFSNMDYLPAYAGGVPVSDTGFNFSVGANTTEYPDAIWVDLNGKRMADEFGLTYAEKQNVWVNAEENIVYIILDEDMKNANEPLLSTGSMKSEPDAEWKMFNDELAKGEVVFSGATVEELAANAGIDPAGLKATVEGYNAAVAAGVDSEFGRTQLTAFGEGPYYAVKTVPYVMLTKGGPMMNDKGQVLTEAGEAIPGLYQCGELMGGANIGGAANIGGLANTITIVWGENAARNAYEYTQQAA